MHAQPRTAEFARVHPGVESAHGQTGLLSSRLPNALALGVAVTQRRQHFPCTLIVSVGITNSSISMCKLHQAWHLVWNCIQRLQTL